jgi:Flp pilus assembly protein TadG
MRTFVRRLRDQRGAELIEMAIVTPILLMILAGIFDFGFLFRGWEVVTNAAREGARVGVLPDYDCDPDMPDDIESRVDAYMAGAGYSDPTAYTVTINAGTVATTGGDFAACQVRVHMFQQLPSLGVIGQFFGGGFTSVPIQASAVMRLEAQATAPAP